LKWIIEWNDKALKELKKLSQPVQLQILKYLRERVKDNPRVFGKGLSYDKVGFWRYRVGDYRIVCKIDDGRLKVVVFAVSHRKDIY
jgi:mRNA interferase RelE/StbE